MLLFNWRNPKQVNPARGLGKLAPETCLTDSPQPTCHSHLATADLPWLTHHVTSCSDHLTNHKWIAGTPYSGSPQPWEGSKLKLDKARCNSLVLLLNYPALNCPVSSWLGWVGHGKTTGVSQLEQVVPLQIGSANQILWDLGSPSRLWPL